MALANDENLSNISGLNNFTFLITFVVVIAYKICKKRKAQEIPILLKPTNSCSLHQHLDS